MSDPLPLSSWGLTTSPTGSVVAAGVALAPLVEEFGSPLHVVDGPRLTAAAQRAIAPHSAGHGVDVFSSYKTNPIPAVLSRLHDAGVGAEAISEYELWLAFELGVEPSRMIYNGPAKSDASLERAAREGVALVNGNSLADLHRMADAAERAGRPLQTGLRVSLPHMWGGQFGIDIDSHQLDDALEFAAASPWLDLIGLHFHSGFGLRTQADFDRHLSAVLACSDTVRQRSDGWHPTWIDLGGSLTCPTVPDATTADPADVFTIPAASTHTRTRADAHFAQLGLPTPHLVFEPGRSLTGDTQLLLTTVIDVRPGTTPVAMLDVGVELAEPLTGSDHRMFVVDRPDATPTTPTRLVGPHPNRADVITDAAQLPDLAVGDIIAVLDTGAYFVPFSTAASHPRPAIVLADNGDATLIRARETHEHRRQLDQT